MRTYEFDVISHIATSLCNAYHTTVLEFCSLLLLHDMNARMNQNRILSVSFLCLLLQGASSFSLPSSSYSSSSHLVVHNVKENHLRDSDATTRTVSRSTTATSLQFQQRRGARLLHGDHHHDHGTSLHMMDTSHLLSIEAISTPSLSLSLSPAIITNLSTQLSPLINITPAEAEALAGPFFGLSLFPYLAFLFFLNVPENDTPKGVTIGFATCLVFVFLTIPAAIAAKVLYGVSLADSDWLHGSAESMSTVTNLGTAVAFRRALRGRNCCILCTRTCNNVHIMYPILSYRRSR